MWVVETQERQPGRRVTHVRPEKVKVGLAAVNGRPRVALDHHPRDAEGIEYYTTFLEFVRFLEKSSVDRDAEGASGTWRGSCSQPPLVLPEGRREAGRGAAALPRARRGGASAGWARGTGAGGPEEDARRQPGESVSGRTDEVVDRLEGAGKPAYPERVYEPADAQLSKEQVEVLKASALCKDAMKGIFPHP